MTQGLRFQRSTQSEVWLVPAQHQTIDPIAHGSNDLAFQRGRWILIGQAILLTVIGCWILVTAGTQGWQPANMLGMQPTWLQGLIFLVVGIASAAVSVSRRAGTIFAVVQAVTFLMLFVPAAAVRHEGPWQLLFGYQATDSLYFLFLAVTGLVLVMWLFPRALADPEWPHSVMRRKPSPPDHYLMPIPARQPSALSSDSARRASRTTVDTKPALVRWAVAVAAVLVLLRGLRRRH